jgi:hypothetical protein
MGLGAYLAAVTDRDHYISEEKRERREVLTKPEDEKEEIFEIMNGYGIDRDASTPMVMALVSNPDEWVRVCFLEPQRHDTRTDPVLQFMMDFELRLEKPNVSRAWISAATMGAAYFIGLSSLDVPSFFTTNFCSQVG